MLMATHDNAVDEHVDKVLHLRDGRVVTLEEFDAVTNREPEAAASYICTAKQRTPRKLLRLYDKGRHHRLRHHQRDLPRRLRRLRDPRCRRLRRPRHGARPRPRRPSIGVPKACRVEELLADPEIEHRRQPDDPAGARRGRLAAVAAGKSVYS